MGIVGLNALLRHGFDIAAVFTHEDDPQENCWFGSVKDWAMNRHIPYYTTDQINTGQWIKKIAEFKPDILFSFYYRKMIGKAILAIPGLGALNLHGSLLPAYRGRCPVNWVLVKGETRTGVTLHFMVEKPDAGDIVGQREVAISFSDTARSLYDQLCVAAGQLLDDLLPVIKTGRVPRVQQNLAEGSYYGGRSPEDGRINWTQPATEIYNLIRAVTDPYPGAHAWLENGEKILVWWATPAETQNENSPGDVFLSEQDVLVKTGRGAIKLLEIDVAGERMQGSRIGEYFRTGKVKRLQ